MLELVDLKGRSKDITRTYSGGMRRRLELARGLLHRPAVLFLDAKIIHMRSASRIGYSDFGVNRERLEKLRSLFNDSAISPVK
jgi:ABC-2 type transport system ATP-binding protein